MISHPLILGYTNLTHSRFQSITSGKPVSRMFVSGDRRMQGKWIDAVSIGFRADKKAESTASDAK
jgi:hypothetical protein